MCYICVSTEYDYHLCSSSESSLSVVVATLMASRYLELDNNLFPDAAVTGNCSPNEIGLVIGLELSSLKARPSALEVQGVNGPLRNGSSHSPDDGLESVLIRSCQTMIPPSPSGSAPSCWSSCKIPSCIFLCSRGGVLRDLGDETTTAAASVAARIHSLDKTREG